MKGRSFGISHVSRVLKKGVVVTLLAFTLGGFAGFLGPSAHAEAITCSAHAIGYAGKSSLLGMNGYIEGWLYAWYSTYDGSYCGYMTAKAHAHLNVGSPWGYMAADVDDCSGNYKAQSNTVHLTGGGDGASGLEYWTLMSSPVSQACGRGLALAGQPGTIWGYISTGNHWA
jgi:hypothetical protein